MGDMGAKSIWQYVQKLVHVDNNEKKSKLPFIGLSGGDTNPLSVDSLHK